MFLAGNWSPSNGDYVPDENPKPIKTRMVSANNKWRFIYGGYSMMVLIALFIILSIIKDF